MILLFWFGLGLLGQLGHHVHRDKGVGGIRGTCNIRRAFPQTRFFIHDLCMSERDRTLRGKESANRRREFMSSEEKEDGGGRLEERSYEMEAVVRKVAFVAGH